jgi:hypothetical protein
MDRGFWLAGEKVEDAPLVVDADAVLAGQLLEPVARGIRRSLMLLAELMRTRVLSASRLGSGPGFLT